jgi:hypothetical protein
MANNGLDSREQVEYRRKLEELLQLPDNKYCADCGTKGMSTLECAVVSTQHATVGLLFWVVGRGARMMVTWLIVDC